MNEVEARSEYEMLIAAAKVRRIRWEPFKYEEHHILPKCLGGTDTKDNLVLLTIKQHRKAHILLAYMYPDDARLQYVNRAFDVFSTEDEQIRDARFEKTKLIAAQKISAIHKGRVKSETERENIRKARRTAKPRKFSEEARANMAAARRKTWEERRANGTHLEIAAKVKETRKRNGSYLFSDEWRKNIGEASKGRVPWNKGKRGELPEETRAKMRESATNRKKHTV